MCDLKKIRIESRRHKFLRGGPIRFVSNRGWSNSDRFGPNSICLLGLLAYPSHPTKKKEEAKINTKAKTNFLLNQTPQIVPYFEKSPLNLNGTTVKFTAFKPDLCGEESGPHKARGQAAHPYLQPQPNRKKEKNKTKASIFRERKWGGLSCMWFSAAESPPATPPWSSRGGESTKASSASSPRNQYGLYFSLAFCYFVETYWIWAIEHLFLVMMIYCRELILLVNIWCDFNLVNLVTGKLDSCWYWITLKSLFFDSVFWT